MKLCGFLFPTTFSGLFCRSLVGWCASGGFEGRDDLNPHHKYRNGFHKVPGLAHVLVLNTYLQQEQLEPHYIIHLGEIT